MADTMISFDCVFCGESAEKKAKDYNRTAKRGKPQCCSQRCSQKFTNKEHNDSHPMRYFTGRAKSKQCVAKKHKDSKPEMHKFLVYDITEESLQEQWKKQKGLCAITKKPMILPDYPYRGANWSGGRHPNNASLDRIDSAEGYYNDNIMFVRLGVNYLKSDWPNEIVEEFFV
jgi:hypothetical protein